MKMTKKELLLEIRLIIREELLRREVEKLNTGFREFPTYPLKLNPNLNQVSVYAVPPTPGTIGTYKIDINSGTIEKKD